MSNPEHPIFARVYDPTMAVAERRLLPEHREWLVSGLSGRVLDLGAGTGAMFPYVAELEGIELHAVEPDPHMRERAAARAAELSLEVELVDASAESLPYASNSFDAVVSSFVFCTIPEQTVALDELARVLEPGGEFRFLEHIRGEGLIGSFHDLVAPAWHTVAGGCNLNRELDRLFQSDDRFSLLEFERVSDGLFPIIRGRLERRPEKRLRDRVDKLPGI